MEALLLGLGRLDVYRASSVGNWGSCGRWLWLYDMCVYVHRYLASVSFSDFPIGMITHSPDTSP